MDEQTRRKWVELVADNLLAEDPTVVTLDAIGEAIGTEAVTLQDIEALVDHLEARGAEVGGPNEPNLPELLKRVLEVARELKMAGTQPTLERVAKASGLSPRAVRVALLYADVLGS